MGKYDLWFFTDETIKNIGERLQDEINNILNNAREEYSNFDCTFASNLFGSLPFITLHIRSYRGTFCCPCCGSLVENLGIVSKKFYVINENVTFCVRGRDHETYFIEDAINR